MGIKNSAVKPARYIIQVKGHLDSHWERWFDEMKITLADNGVTVLSGEVVDQSELHGILETIHSLNLILLSVQRISPDEEN